MTAPAKDMKKNIKQNQLKTEQLFRHIFEGKKLRKLKKKEEEKAKYRFLFYDKSNK